MEYQKQLNWVDNFVREEVEALDFVMGNPFDKSDQHALSVASPLQQQVKERGLWAAHLDPELGGQGYGQLKLALLNEVLGRSRWAPSIFGCQAPDSGNAEILARYGTAEQKDKYLEPLLDGLITSCYSMTACRRGSLAVHHNSEERQRQMGDQRREVVFDECPLCHLLSGYGHHFP